jgi:transcriptional regulator with XRE-family HTH domain
MNLEFLQENLRLEILRRIRRGLLSGAELARSSGFRHAHISNFLHGKRTLSLQGFDRILAAGNLSVLDLIPALNPDASNSNGSSPSVQTIPVVTQEAAIFQPRIAPPSILETIPVPDSALQLALARPAAGRSVWLRFVAIRADAEHAVPMYPLLQQDSIAVVDRHYNSLARYRPMQPTMYAVHSDGRLHVCFLNFEANRLILRPRNLASSVRLIELAPYEQPSDRIVGRICYVATTY